MSGGFKITQPRTQYVALVSNAGNSGNAEGIGGTPVCATVPSIGDALIFNGTEWCPAPFTPSGTFLTKTDGEGHTVQDHGATGSTETIDPALGNWHLLTLDANCTITLTAPALGPGCLLQVFLVQDGTGSRTVTWPAEVIWPAGTAPTLTTTADHVDTITLATYDGGANWYGSFEAGGSSLIVKDEGTPLATAATSLDFVGAGVAATGSGAGKTVTIPGQTFATPAIVLGTAAAAGAASTGIRSDSTIVAFDATVPVTQAFGDAAATGSAAVASRRDHRHGMPSAADVVALLGPQHVHVNNLTFSGDGAATAFEIPASPVDAYSVMAYVAGVRTAITMSGALLTTMTFAVAPVTGTDNIIVDIAAAVA